MKIAVCIIDHDQDASVARTIKKLGRQTKKPDEIIVCCDSDIPFVSDRPDVSVVHELTSGRCLNRNNGARWFLDSDCDAIVFLDGDCCPKHTNFLQKYSDLLEKYGLVFGTREHSMPKRKLELPPSDLLTANMDNLYRGKKLDSTDLRVASGAVDAWNRASTFEERLDLMVTGMIGWSCNFGFTRKALAKHMSFMKTAYGRYELFDSNAFNGSWGYEDVAMGIDALYAGISIGISDDLKVVHSAHDRTDGLFDHVNGRHLIMQRVRVLEKSAKVKNMAYTVMLVMFLAYIAGIITGLVTGAIAVGTM